MLGNINYRLIIYFIKCIITVVSSPIEYALKGMIMIPEIILALASAFGVVVLLVVGYALLILLMLSEDIK